MKIDALDLLGERIDVALRLFVEIGDGEIGAEGVKGLGASPGDRLVVGDAGDERLLSLEQRQAKRDRSCSLLLELGRGLRAQARERVARDHQLLVGRE